MSMLFTIYSKVGLFIVAFLASLFVTGGASVREQTLSIVSWVAVPHSSDPLPGAVQVERPDSNHGARRRAGSGVLMLVHKDAGRTETSVPWNAVHEISHRTSALGKEVSTSLPQSKPA